MHYHWLLFTKWFYPYHVAWWRLCGTVYDVTLMKTIKKAEKGGVKFGPLYSPTMTELHSDDTQLSGASLNRRVSLVLIDCGCPAGGGGGRSVIVLFNSNHQREMDSAFWHHNSMLLLESGIKCEAFTERPMSVPVYFILIKPWFA